MPNAQDVANYFLATLGADEESDLTNMKMQKLCAYAQGLSLALLGVPLFPENLEAWQYGPVIASLYESYKANARHPLPPTELTELDARRPFNDEQKFILELTREYYGSKTAPVLRKMSHLDFPGKFRSKEIIPIDEIKDKFEDVPIVKKLKDFVPEKNGGRVYSEREFLDALRD